MNTIRVLINGKNADTRKFREMNVAKTGRVLNFLFAQLLNKGRQGATLGSNGNW
jgi:hypothetical protein